MNVTVGLIGVLFLRTMIRICLSLATVKNDSAHAIFCTFYQFYVSHTSRKSVVAILCEIFKFTSHVQFRHVDHFGFVR